MKKLKWICLLTTVLIAFTFVMSSCIGGGEPTGENGELKITYYEGGTGKVWIETLASKFEKETGVKVILTADPMATENAITLLQSGRNLPDLMFILQTGWQKYVQSGWLEELDDLYNGTFKAEYTVGGETKTIGSVYDVTGTTLFTDSGKTTGVNLTDMLIDDFEDYGYISETFDSEPHYYVESWTAPCTGFVYNVDLLKSVGYDAPPATEEEFRECCAKLVENGIAPFAWGGSGMEIAYWDFITETWWAQYSGLDKWKEFYQFESADVYNDPGRAAALGLWQDLIVSPTDGSFINSIEKPMGKDHNDAQRSFVKGEAAFTPTGSWVETETEKFVLPGFNMRMMSVPTINGAKTGADGKPIKIQNTSAGDFACIPKKAANKQAAKAFLAFMNRPENVEYFTVETGIPRAFNYTPSKLGGISDFAKSCFELFEESECMYQNSKSPLFIYGGVERWCKYGTNIYGNLAGANRQSASAIANDMYTYAKSMWNTWSKAAGL